VDPEEWAGFHPLGGLIFNIARWIPKTGEFKQALQSRLPGRFDLLLGN
jgi:hypothetical protein